MPRLIYRKHYSVTLRMPDVNNSRLTLTVRAPEANLDDPVERALIAARAIRAAHTLGWGRCNDSSDVLEVSRMY